MVEEPSSDGCNGDGWTRREDILRWQGVLTKEKGSDGKYLCITWKLK